MIKLLKKIQLRNRARNRDIFELIGFSKNINPNFINNGNDNDNDNEKNNFQDKANLRKLNIQK